MIDYLPTHQDAYFQAPEANLTAMDDCSATVLNEIHTPQTVEVLTSFTMSDGLAHHRGARNYSSNPTSTPRGLLALDCGSG